MQTALPSFTLFPWVGGVNTSLTPALIPANQLVKAQHCVFGTRGSRKKRDGIDYDYDSASNGTDSIVAGHDFWFGAASRSQRKLGLTDGKALYSYNGATRSADLFAGTAWSSTVTRGTFLTFNNLAILAVDGTGNVMKKWNGSGNFADLGGTPPVASILCEHLSRVWTDDKATLDRLHYSTTGNHEEWNGAGDSGAIDVKIGDGDPEGITAIRAFKGTLFVWKKTKLYKITGSTPETFKVELVSSGVGCASHNSIVAVDQDDLYFVSEKGIHSLAATDTYGDFEGAYVSVDIQATFNDHFDKARLKYVWGGYLPHVNSIAFTFTDTRLGSGENNTIWFYNIPLKSWYEWPNVSCESMFVVRDADKSRFYVGTSTTRLGKTFNGTNYDISTAGANTAINFIVETGLIAVDGNILSTKGFKSFSLIHTPVPGSQITVSVKIDNFSSQALSYQEGGSGDLLGTTFILGSSILGGSGITAPYPQTIDGYGRLVKVTIQQSGTNQAIEIEGFSIEYEPAGMPKEVLTA